MRVDLILLSIAPTPGRNVELDFDLVLLRMPLETKFLRLRTPVTLGSRFGEWQVTWLGGWGRHRLYYLVMVVKIKPRNSVR